MITTVINPFDQLVTSAREALAALDDQDALLVEQLRSMAGEAGQRAEQRRRIEACLDALVPISLPAEPEPLEVQEEPVVAATMPSQPYDSPPIPEIIMQPTDDAEERPEATIKDSLVVAPPALTRTVRQIPEASAPRGAGHSMECPKCGNHYASKAHRDACRKGTAAAPLEAAPVAEGA